MLAVAGQRLLNKVIDSPPGDIKVKPRSLTSGCVTSKSYKFISPTSIPGGILNVNSVQV